MSYRKKPSNKGKQVKQPEPIDPLISQQSRQNQEIEETALNANGKKRNLGGRPQNEVWKHYEKKSLKSAGHFSAKCNYCMTFWPRGHPNELEEHLANNCKQVPELVNSFYLGVVSSRGFGNELLNNNKKERCKIQISAN